MKRIESCSRECPAFRSCKERICGSFLFYSQKESRQCFSPALFGRCEIQKIDLEVNKIPFSGYQSILWPSVVIIGRKPYPSKYDTVSGLEGLGNRCNKTVTVFPPKFTSKFTYQLNPPRPRFLLSPTMGLSCSLYVVTPFEPE